MVSDALFLKLLMSFLRFLLKSVQFAWLFDDSGLDSLI